ncbi:hypothetical protein M3O45_19110 [Xanthomonas nasturtii]|nr:hypothetical protein [Xanthomonas nasturtii]
MTSVSIGPRSAASASPIAPCGPVPKRLAVTDSVVSAPASTPVDVRVTPSLPSPTANSACTGISMSSKRPRPFSPSRARYSAPPARLSLFSNCTARNSSSTLLPLLRAGSACVAMARGCGSLADSSGTSLRVEARRRRLGAGKVEGTALALTGCGNASSLVPV